MINETYRTQKSSKSTSRLILILWILVCQAVLAFVEEAVLQLRGRFGLCLVSFLRWLLLLTIYKMKIKFFKTFAQHLIYGGKQWNVVVVVVVVLTFFTCEWVRTPGMLTATCSWICWSNRPLSTAQPCFASFLFNFLLCWLFPFRSQAAYSSSSFYRSAIILSNFGLNKIS